MHTHSFVEIAFAVGGTATHHSQAGRREMQRPGDVLLLRPGVWHGYENCQQFEVYNCCFNSELLRRELSWTREDPLLGFLLWAGPYSSPSRGVLSISLPSHVLSECRVHLDALAALRHRPPRAARPGHRRPPVAAVRPARPGRRTGPHHPARRNRGRASRRGAGHTPARGRPGPRLDTDGPGRRAAPRPGISRPAVQRRHRSPSHGLPGPAPAPSTPPFSCCTQTSRSRASGARSAGPTKAASPGVSKPITGSAPPTTASASPPALPTFTFQPRPRPRRLLGEVADRSDPQGVRGDGESRIERSGGGEARALDERRGCRRRERGSLGQARSGLGRYP